MKGQKAQKGTLKKVLHYIRPYWALVGLSVLLAAVTVAASLYIPILTGNAVDYIVGPGNVDFPGILRILVEIGLVIAVAALSQWVMSLINNRITYRVVRDIRNKAFQKIQILPLKYLDGHPTGEVSAGSSPTWTSSPTACSWALPSCSAGCSPLWARWCSCSVSTWSSPPWWW